MSWLTLSIIALTLFVFYDIAGRYLATRSKNPQAFAIIYNLAVTLLAPFLFFFDKTLPSAITPKVIIFTIAGLIIWGLFGRFEYFAKKHTEVSTLTIVTKLDIILNFILVVIFLREPLTSAKLIGMLLIVLANIFLFWGQSLRSILQDKGIKYSLLIAVFLAFGWLFDTINVKSWGVATFSILSFLSPILASSFFPRVKLTELKTELALNPIWQIFLMGLFNLAGYALMLKALTLGPASSVMPIVTSTSPFVVILGLFFLGEKDNLPRKLSAATLAVIAIYLMR